MQPDLTVLRNNVSCLKVSPGKFRDEISLLAAILLLYDIRRGVNMLLPACNNEGLLGKGKIERFYLDVKRSRGNFHFPIVPIRTLGVNISHHGKENLFFGAGENRTVHCNL